MQSWIGRLAAVGFLFLVLVDAARAELVIDLWTGRVFHYSGNGSTHNFLLHVENGHEPSMYPCEKDNCYTYLYTIPTNFAGFMAAGQTTSYPGATLGQQDVFVGDPNHPLTWCEMTDAAGTTIYASGNLSQDQLKVNITCECIRQGTCQGDIVCRPEDPEQPTALDMQLRAPMCQ